jgi:hypothetical protein
MPGLAGAMAKVCLAKSQADKGLGLFDFELEQ